MGRDCYFDFTVRGRTLFFSCNQHVFRYWQIILCTVALMNEQSKKRQNDNTKKKKKGSKWPVPRPCPCPSNRKSAVVLPKHFSSSDSAAPLGSSAVHRLSLEIIIIVPALVPFRFPWFSRTSPQLLLLPYKLMLHRCNPPIAVSHVRPSVSLDHPCFWEHFHLLSSALRPWWQIWGRLDFI